MTHTTIPELDTLTRGESTYAKAPAVFATTYSAKRYGHGRILVTNMATQAKRIVSRDLARGYNEDESNAVADVAAVDKRMMGRPIRVQESGGYGPDGKRVTLYTVTTDAYDSADYGTRDVRIVQLSANWTRVYLPGGGTLWFSYETCVAAAMPGFGVKRTAQRYSTTTAKHLGSDALTSNAERLDADEFAKFLGNVR